MNNILQKYSCSISKYSERYSLRESLICAVILVESGGDCYAVRYEPHWKWFLNPKNWSVIVGVTQDTERVCQQMSWGLMQVMGTVSRELGNNKDIPQLIEPDIGIHYGCKKLRKCINRWGSEEKGLAAYNAGSPTRKGKLYAEKVLQKEEELLSASKESLTS